MTLPSLPPTVIEPIVRRALDEDFGNAGDVTANLLVPEAATGTLYFRSRETGVIAGMQAAEITYRMVDPHMVLTVIKGNGSTVRKGDVIAEVTGPVRSLLMAERTALNFLGRMSGIATLTAQYVDLIKGTNAGPSGDRKTRGFGRRRANPSAVFVRCDYDQR